MLEIPPGSGPILRSGEKRRAFPDPPPRGHPFHELRILVIEDQPDLRAGILHALRGQGYAVDEPGMAGKDCTARGPSVTMRSCWM